MGTVIIIQVVVFGFLMSRVRDIRNLVTICVLLSSIFIFCLPIVKNVIYTSALVFALAGSICMVPPALTVMMTMVSGGRHGTLLGLRNSVSNLARALSPILNGAVYDVFFPPIFPSKTMHLLPFVMCCVLLIDSALVMRFCDKLSTKKNDEKETETIETPKETTKLLN